MEECAGSLAGRACGRWQIPETPACLRTRGVSSLDLPLLRGTLPLTLPSAVRNAYNQRVVQTFSSSRSGRARQWLGLGVALALFFTVCAGAQTAAEAGPTSGGRILLVLPFDNRTGQPSLEWI